jgi:predicted transcriptional regulator
VTIKERLHQAVEAMSDDEARAALRTLAEASGDPVAWTLDHAVLDDEAETEEERQAVAEAHADRARGVEPVPLEDVLAVFAGE